MPVRMGEDAGTMVGSSYWVGKRAVDGWPLFYSAVSPNALHRSARQVVRHAGLLAAVIACNPAEVEAGIRAQWLTRRPPPPSPLNTVSPPAAILDDEVRGELPLPIHPSILAVWPRWPSRGTCSRRFSTVSRGWRFRRRLLV